ncbi:MAG: SDR family oxidoreductase [Candidatus Omnitrophica bacterium]|nr:SDR family oxidoreductase [Candidatus Omnitrophota bacterium]
MPLVFRLGLIKSLPPCVITRKTAIFFLDVTDVESVKNAVSKIKAQHGRLDVLVNNAGYGIGGFFEDLTQDEIRSQMETNFFGVQNVTREVLPLMREQKHGLIINISSISGLAAWPCFGAYNASKWALEGFSESLFYELMPFGIKVCLIEPGVYRTKIFYENRKYATNFFNHDSPYYKTSQIFQKRLNDHIKANDRDPEEVAATVEKLINSENPSFRNIPDSRSRLLYAVRRFLPFRLFSWIAAKVLYTPEKSNKEKR